MKVLISVTHQFKTYQLLVYFQYFHYWYCNFFISSLRCSLHLNFKWQIVWLIYICVSMNIPSTFTRFHYFIDTFKWQAMLKMKYQLNWFILCLFMLIIEWVCFMSQVRKVSTPLLLSKREQISSFLSNKSNLKLLFDIFW